MSTFSVEITGNGLNEESIAVLLHGLDQLRVPGFGLGADSGDGQGCLWQLKLIRRLRKADLETWKSAATATDWNSCGEPLGRSGTPSDSETKCSVWSDQEL